MPNSPPSPASPAPLPLINIDTGMIIAGQILKTIARTGRGMNLFDEGRGTRHGAEIPGFG